MKLIACLCGSMAAANHFVKVKRGRVRGSGADASTSAKRDISLFDHSTAQPIQPQLDPLQPPFDPVDQPLELGHHDGEGLDRSLVLNASHEGQPGLALVQEKHGSGAFADDSIRLPRAGSVPLLAALGSLRDMDLVGDLVFLLQGRRHQFEALKPIHSRKQILYCRAIRVTLG